MTIEGLIKELQLLTISGNDIPVDRCTIKAESLALILKSHQQLVDALLSITAATMSEADADSWTEIETQQADTLLKQIIEKEIEE